MILAEFKPQSVTVEVKKFSIPQARHVSVSLTRETVAARTLQTALTILVASEWS